MGSSSNKDAKGSGKQGIVIAIFLGLFAAGGIAAYLVMFNQHGSGDEQNQPPRGVKQPVVETKSLIEAPPPVPEDTAPLSVTDAGTDSGVGQKTGGKGGGAWVATGTMDPSVAKSFINARTAKVRSCYEKELKINTILQGTVTTAISINMDGSVSNVKFLTDNIHSKPLNECIRKEISSWTFPKPQGGRVEVQFPFRFEPKNK